MIWKGFKFGMLLQLAVGPVCLFVFQTAAAKGWLAAQAGVLGVCIADGAYILLALLGIGTLLQKNERFKRMLGIFGAIVLIVFGASSLLGAFSIAIVPSIHLHAQYANPFLAALALTLSNPLSILFWAGVFTARIADERLAGTRAYSFAAGAVLSTMCFLSAIGLLGSAAGVFLGDWAIRLLNAAVGMALMGFGVSSLLKNGKKEDMEEQA